MNNNNNNNIFQSETFFSQKLETPKIILFRLKTFSHYSKSFFAKFLTAIFTGQTSASIVAECSIDGGEVQRR